MKPTMRAARGPLVLLLALCAALVIAACGGSSGSNNVTGSTGKNASATTTTKTASSTRTALASCLKQHGVTIGARRFRGGTGTTGTPPGGGGFPGGGGTPPAGAGAPPSGAGGGFPGGGGGFAGGNSKFAKAFTACDKKLGIKAGAGFGRFGGRPGAGNFTPRFSTATLTSYVSCIRKNGYAAMPEPKAASNGSFFPKSVESNAKFKAANRKCESILTKAFRSFRPPAGGGAGGTSTLSGTSTVSNA